MSTTPTDSASVASRLVPVPAPELDPDPPSPNPPLPSPNPPLPWPVPFPYWSPQPSWPAGAEPAAGVPLPVTEWSPMAWPIAIPPPSPTASTSVPATAILAPRRCRGWAGGGVSGWPNG